MEPVEYWVFSKASACAIVGAGKRRTSRKTGGTGQTGAEKRAGKVRLHLGRFVRQGTILLTIICVVALAAARTHSAPYAAMVMDARSGEVLHSRNADTRLHPASLTKMMTLYVVFEAVENGELSLDDRIRISRNAAAEPSSKLGLRAGQRIRLRHLIRAAAVKSANDAATALAEAVSGSEAAFARRMNRTARALGMNHTTFRNAHGLTESGHLSTARDMTNLGRRLFYHYPDYYNLFSRQSTHAGIAEVRNTNRRLLAAYRGADGIKTGYTRAAGFNLVASAERGGVRIIATVFGGRSSTTRNVRVAELLDMGFSRTHRRVTARIPPLPVYAGGSGGMYVIVRSLRPAPRPARLGAPALPEDTLLAMEGGIQEALEQAREDDANTSDPAAIASRDGIDTAVGAALAFAAPEAQGSEIHPETFAEPAEPVVVTRVSASGGRHCAVNVGRYGSRYRAESVLLRTALQEMETLDGALRRVVNRGGGFEANFMGLTQESADLACRRLRAQQVECNTIGPS